MERLATIYPSSKIQIVFGHHIEEPPIPHHDILSSFHCIDTINTDSCSLSFNELIEYAIKEFHADNLWALEKNTRAISFYQNHGFHRYS